jgi:hypothetical protein
LFLKWNAKQHAGSKTNLQPNLTEIAGSITPAICMDQAGAMAGTACRRRLGDQPDMRRLE